MQFEEDYFAGRGYVLREEQVKRHVLEVLKWASKASGGDLFSGGGRRALDVGCAFGYASKVLETLGYETCSVDVSKWGVGQAKENVGGDVLVCDTQAVLPFKAASFDLVICFDVLEHLQFPERAIQVMLDACSGTLVCTTPNRAVEKPVRKIIGDFDETHINVRSASEWKRSIDKMGLALVKVETFFDVTAKLANKRVVFRSFRMPNFGLTVRILVRK